MEKNDCFSLGYIQKPTGTAGELLFQLDSDDPARYRGLDMVLAELNGGLVPFFIRSIRISGNRATAQLEGVDSRDAAELLAGAGLFLPLSLLPPLGDKEFYLHEVPGFELVDEAFGPVGTIEEVIEYPAQRVIRVLRGRTEILVPLSPGVLQKVDRAARQVHVRTPEGLIDLYLQI